MDRISQGRLDKILYSHELWLCKRPGGKRAILCDKDMSGLDLSSRVLTFSNMSDSNLCRANLRNAKIQNANLSNTNLQKVNAEYALFCESNLAGADLRYANLKNAMLYRANLSGAYISNANIEGTIWAFAFMEIMDAHYDGTLTKSFIDSLLNFKEGADAIYASHCYYYDEQKAKAEADSSSNEQS